MGLNQLNANRSELLRTDTAFAMLRIYDPVDDDRALLNRLTISVTLNLNDRMTWAHCA